MAEAILKFPQRDDRFQFIYACIDDVTGENPLDLTDYGRNTEACSMSELASAADFVRDIYRVSACEGAKTVRLKSEIDQQLREMIQDCYDVRREDIIQALAIESIRKSDVSVVENIDWKLKLIMGSSKLATLRKPVVQMDLHCLAKERDGPRRNINFEMDLEQVDALIEKLKNVKVQLEKAAIK